MSGILDTVWTPHRDKLKNSVQSSQFRLLLQVRLLELALSNDDRVAVEALKLLVPMAGESSGGIDPILDALPSEHLEEVISRAEQFISKPGGESGDSLGEAIPRAEVIAALRTTDHADLSGGEAPSDHHDGVGDAGSG